MENNENMNKKCELTDDELAAVAGGSGDETWGFGDWCSYESIKDQFPCSHAWVDDPETEVACRVKFARPTPHGYILDIEGFIHYYWRISSLYDGRWFTESIGTTTVEAAYAKKINAPEWADECNQH